MKNRQELPYHRVQSDKQITTALLAADEKR